MRAPWYFVAYVIPLTAGVGVGLRGWWLLATPLFIFILTPLMDHLIGTDEGNFDGAGESAEKANPIYDLVLRMWVPLQLSIMVYGLWVISHADITGAEAVGLTASVGWLGGLGINVAHELMHRRSKLDRALAEILMTSVSYTHFCVEHVHGHHKNVATPLDPATARLGDSIYRFIPRSVVGGMRSFWRIEGRLAARKGYGRFDPRNRRFRYPLVWALVVAAVAAVFGPVGALVFIAQGIVGFVLLEIINFLEHYGLERREIAPGRYERVQPQHSWNSSFLLTRLYLFGLPRHSDHHYLASRPYAILRHHDDAPQLPSGYATMFVLALVPPLWRAVMDPRVAAVRAAHDDPVELPEAHSERVEIQVA